MKLKNFLLVVEDIERSKAFYKELFGLDVIRDFETNVILTQGLVLQQRTDWEQAIADKVVYDGKTTVLYFEDYNLESFQRKIEESGREISFLNRLHTLENGQKMMRLQDPDGHIIEIREIII